MVARKNLICLTYCMVLYVGRANGEELTTIRENCKAMARSVSSVEYETESTFSNGAKIKSRIARDGERYYWDSRIIKSGTGPGKFQEDGVAQTVAYDLQNHQVLDQNAGLLRYTSVATEGIGIETLLVPYWWLVTATTPKMPDWLSLRSDSVWDRAFERATILREELFAKHRCVIVRFRCEANGHDSDIDVWFAKDCGYFPVRYIRQASGGSGAALQYSEYSCADVHEYTRDGRKIALPLNVGFAETGNDGVSLECSFVSRIDPKSLRTDQMIPAELFTISPSRAQKTVDIHAEHLKFSTTAKPVTAIPSLWRVVLICVVVCTAGFTLTFAWRGRQKTGG